MVALRRRKWGAALGILLVVLATSGCGRRGRLEPPPDPQNPFALGTPKPVDVSAKPGEKAKASAPRRAKNPAILPPDEPFVLDPML